MLPIVSNPEEITMNSYQFLNEVINPIRVSAGESAHENRKFIKKIMDELDLKESDAEKKSAQFLSGNSMARGDILVFTINYDQMILVGMRESKAVRKSVLDKLKELSMQVEKKIAQLPDFSNPAEAARAWAEQFERAAIAEKTKSQINDKRTATLMNKASQDAKKIKKLEIQLQDQGSYLSLIAADLPQRVDTEMRSNVQSWRLLKRISETLGHEIVKVKDPRYGEVNTYHVDVIEEFKHQYL